MLKRFDDEISLQQILTSKGNVCGVMSAHLDCYGLSQKFLEFWGDETGTVIMRYFDGYEIASETNDLTEVAAFLSMCPTIFKIDGETKTMEHLQNNLDMKSQRHNFSYAVMDNKDKLCNYSDVEIQKATMNQMPQIYEFLISLNSFTLPQYDEYYYSQYQRQKLRAGSVYTIIKDDTLLATAQIHPQGKTYALLGAIGVSPLARRQGLASKIVSFVANEMLTQNITPIIKYENPIARQVYLNIGFREVGEFSTFFI